MNISFRPCDTPFQPYLSLGLALRIKKKRFYPILLKFGTQFFPKKILSFWKFQLHRWLLWPITLKNVFFRKKNHISSPIYPIYLKFVVVINIMNIYHKKNSEIHFRNFGAKFEFLESIKNLYFQKKLIFIKFREVVHITKNYHQNFFQIFWR